MVPQLKDLIHICLETAAQDPSRTLKILYIAVVTRQPSQPLGWSGSLTLFPMGVGHECFFEEQIIIMLMQTEICSCKLNDNSVLSIFKARRALVSHFVNKN